MTAHPLPKLFALMLAAAFAAAWLSTIVLSMQDQKRPILHSIELPTVVIVAHKGAVPQATAQAQPVPGNNG